MNIKTIVAALALTVAFAAPAMAGSFSFNKSSADEMIAAAKEEGITLPKEVADAIVTYRATTPIKTEGDLGKVPGVTPQLIQQLYPIEDGDDLLFDPSSMPGMKGY